MSAYPSPGESIGRFEVLSRLGEGGMGVVFEALEVTLERTVALKVIAPAYADDPAFRARFAREARAMAALRPRARLVGASPSPATARQLTLSWGVEPLEVAEYHTTDEMVWCVVEAAVEAGLVHHGEAIAVLAGAPDAAARTTDVLRVVQVE